MGVKELYITEKPAVARAVVDALDGSFKKREGYYVDDTGIAVAWCIGHMLQLQEPEDYDPKLKQWSFDSLPLFFSEYRHKPNPKLVKNLNAIKKLLSVAETVIHAGDTDDEGQLLVDEILRFYSYKKPVYRILINDNTRAVVRKAIAKKEPNTKFEHLGWRAEARSLSDLLFGFNLTRAYTLKSQAEGGEGVVSVGRVQTPILGLVVRRDRLNSGHKKQNYYKLLSKLSVGSSNFIANFVGYSEGLAQKISNGESQLSELAIDDKGRYVKKPQMVEVAKACKGKEGVVTDYAENKKEKAAPLPYNLNKLQQDANQKWGYKPKDVVKITQELKDTYQLITYNRSDCQYLSDEHHENAGDHINAVVKNVGGDLQSQAKNADPAVKGRAFNSSKVDAHHAIVPSATVADMSKLSEQQKNIYLLIARLYIAQFLPNSVYVKKRVEVDVEGNMFKATSSTRVKDGWEVLFLQEPKEQEEGEDSDGSELMVLTKGSQVDCVGLKIEDKTTSPPPYYTIKTLLADLTKVAKYVKDPRLAKILIEKDKEKSSENGGIGTSATRHVALDTLFERGFLEEKGKKVVSTKKGQEFYDRLDDKIKYPDLSAIWAERQLNIKGREDVINFSKQMMKEVVIPEIKKIKGSIKYFKCPKCGRNMNRISSVKGVFWGCSGYSDKDNQCKHSMDDKDGQPVEKKPKLKTAVKKTNFDCGCCEGKLGYKKGKKSYYFECLNDDCRQKYFKSKEGKKPDYENPPK